MATITVNGIDLFYREAGSGPTLLLIHGTGFNADVWDDVIEPLAQRHRVIAYDRRGYGRSKGDPAPKATYMAQQAEDMIALLRALNAAPAILLGWSAGAIHALVATRSHPDCVKRLILYEPPLFVFRYMDLSFGLAFFKLNIQSIVGQKQAAAETFTRLVLAYHDGRDGYEMLSPAFRSALAADARTLLAELAAGPNGVLNADILAREIRLPVTLLLGAESST